MTDKLKVEEYRAATAKSVEEYNTSMAHLFLHMLQVHIQNQGLEAPDWKAGIAFAVCTGVEFADNTFAPGLSVKLEEYLHRFNTDKADLARRQEAYDEFADTIAAFQEVVEKSYSAFTSLTDQGLTKQEATDALCATAPSGKLLN